MFLRTQPHSDQNTDYCPSFRGKLRKILPLGTGEWCVILWWLLPFVAFFMQILKQNSHKGVSISHTVTQTLCFYNHIFSYKNSRVLHTINVHEFFPFQKLIYRHCSSEKKNFFASEFNCVEIRSHWFVLYLCYQLGAMNLMRRWGKRWKS